MGHFNKQVKYIALSVIASFAILLQGCATSVSRLSDDGNDEIIFPNIEKSAWIKEGTFPNVDNLRNVAPDMTKNQLYALLGNPHFTEGFGKVREWDYIFNFRKNGSTEVDTCQYKIVYTTSMKLRNTYWKPESCAEWLALTEAQPQDEVEKTVERIVPGPELIKMQISADGMFDFDKSEIINLRPGGVEKLNRLTTSLLAGGEIVQL